MNDLSLAGPWRFELDPSDQGVAHAWYKRPLEVCPIVQVIDNFERNHRLGVLLECSVGQGQLLVCSCNVLEQ